MTNPECPQPAADPARVLPRSELEAQGWIRRYVADPIRAREAMELYPRMGFEVRAEPMSPAEVGAECSGCASASCPLYVVIYTRRKG